MNPATVLKQARREAGLTQVALGRRLGSSQAAVARLERPGANPTVSTLQRALSATGHRLLLDVAPQDTSVDETLIASYLRMSPAERLRAFHSSHESLARLKRMAAPSS